MTKDTVNPNWYNPAIMEFVKVVDGLAFPEGPTWDRKGGLFVVNVYNNRLERFQLSKEGVLERKALYAELPGKGNGTTLHADGTLYVADYERRAILRVPAPNRVEVVVDRYEGQPLRGPNDLCFDKQGNLYFTDPRESWDTPIGTVYRLSKEGKLEPFGKNLHFPNGIAIDPDQRYVYVAETRRNRILRWALRDGEVVAREPELFATLAKNAIGPDGMRFDREGNLWVAHYGRGVVKLDPTGKEVAVYTLPGKGVTNLEFGGEQGQWLFVTETETNAVYRATLKGAD